eukprot:s4943_g2.t1
MNALPFLLAGKATALLQTLRFEPGWLSREGGCPRHLGNKDRSPEAWEGSIDQASLVADHVKRCSRHRLCSG